MCKGCAILIGAVKWASGMPKGQHVCINIVYLLQGRIIMVTKKDPKEHWAKAVRVGNHIAQELGQSAQHLLEGECAVLLHIASSRIAGCAIYESSLGYWPLKEVCHKNDAVELSEASQRTAMDPAQNIGEGLEFHKLLNIYLGSFVSFF